MPGSCGASLAASGMLPPWRRASAAPSRSHPVGDRAAASALRPVRTEFVVAARASGSPRRSCRCRSRCPRGRPRSPPADRGACARASRARGLDVVGLRREPDQHLTGPAPSPSSARMSGVGSRTRSGAPWSFFSFVSAGDLRPEVGDGGGHHHGVGRRRALAGRRRASARPSRPARRRHRAAARPSRARGPA